VLLCTSDGVWRVHWQLAAKKVMLMKHNIASIAAGETEDEKGGGCAAASASPCDASTVVTHGLHVVCGRACRGESATGKRRGSVASVENA
jgi:hypothetical protein